MVGKNYLDIAPEATYGVAPATGWKGIAVEDHGGHTVDVSTLQPKTMVYGQHGPTVTGRRTVEKGAKGTIKTYLASTGLLLLLRAWAGDVVKTTLEADEAYEYVFTTTNAMSTHSLATQVGREFGGGTMDRDTYVGGQIGELRLMQAMLATGTGVSDEGLAKVEFDLDYQKRDPDLAQKLPTYPDPELYMSAGDCTISIGADLDTLDGDDVECLKSWSLKAPTGASFDPECMSVHRDKASRGALPAPTVEMEWVYKTRDYYDAFLAGEILALRSVWTPSGAIEISDGIKPSVTVDIPAFALTGETPETANEGKTQQKLPGDILWNETDPMITITVVTSESDY